MTVTATVPVGPAIPSLVRWGLTSDADLVFRTIAAFGPRSARTLAGELGLARPRVESALAELFECGAAAAATADRGALIWSNRPGSEVVERLRARRLRTPDPAAVARRHHATVQMLDHRLAGLGLPRRPVLAGVTADGVRYLPTRPLTRRRLAAAMAAERHDHLVINNEEDVNADITRAAPDRTRGNAGVSYRILTQPPLDDDAIDPFVEDHDEVRRFTGSPYTFRETRDTPLKMFVCDRRIAFIPADPDDLDRGYLEISQADVVRALVELFESRWAEAIDPRAHGVPAIVLSVRERDLIDLLAAGHTDVTAAEELRISSRSVTNTLRALMDRLGVDNRFQLGLALGAMRVTLPPSLSSAPGG